MMPEKTRDQYSSGVDNKDVRTFNIVEWPILRSMGFFWVRALGPFGLDTARAVLRT